MTSRTVVLMGLGWLLVAIAAGAAGIVPSLPPAPLVVFALTLAVLAAGWLLAGFNAWLATIDVRWLVALHLTRFVGFYFLYLYGRGELPYAFAVPGGWGDIAVATLALPVCFVPMNAPLRRRAITIWNVVGLVD